MWIWLIIQVTFQPINTMKLWVFWLLCNEFKIYIVPTWILKLCTNFISKYKIIRSVVLFFKIVNDSIIWFLTNSCVELLVNKLTKTIKSLTSFHIFTYPLVLIVKEKKTWFRPIINQHNQGTFRPILVQEKVY
jgi:hypothetical protein